MSPSATDEPRRAPVSRKIDRMIDEGDMMGAAKSPADASRRRVFLDTSVITAILRGQGAAPRLLSEDVTRRVQFAVNPIVLQELLHLPDARANSELLEAIRRNWQILPIDEEAFSAFLRDAQALRNRAIHSNDLLILGSAAECDYLVTYDRDLMLVASDRPIILTPEQFLDELGRLR
jgi:predicted nucleic acid-binding protein